MNQFKYRITLSLHIVPCWVSSTVRTGTDPWQNVQIDLSCMCWCAVKHQSTSYRSVFPGQFFQASFSSFLYIDYQTVLRKQIAWSLRSCKCFNLLHGERILTLALSQMFLHDIKNYLTIKTKIKIIRFCVKYFSCGNNYINKYHQDLIKRFIDPRYMIHIIKIWNWSRETPDECLNVQRSVRSTRYNCDRLQQLLWSSTSSWYRRRWRPSQPVGSSRVELSRIESIVECVRLELNSNTRR